MSRYNWSIVFFLGLARDAKTMDMILEEAAHNGDIVIFPYMDTYRNLTYKYVYGMKWTMDNCPSAKYIVKMDDDIVLNLYKLLRYIDQRTESEKPAFHCCVWEGMPVLRHTMSPWYLSEKLYPPNVFPTYCSGSTVIFRSSILRPLYNASFELPFLSVDDALVTGEMARIAGVGHVSLNRYYSFSGDQWKKVVKGEIIFGHIHGERARVRGWKAVVKELLAKRKRVPKAFDSNAVSKSLRTSSLGIRSTAGALIIGTTTSNRALAVNQVSRLANNHAADDLTGEPESDSSTNSITSTTDMRVIRSNALPSS
uniref:Hexosyltransferase n=1 Tax=Ixodes scapularis TaxID=6945 RepID=A0A4D5RUH4_IXOSC